MQHSRENTDALCYLIARGVCVCTSTDCGISPLCMTCRGGSLSTVQVLLMTGAIDDVGAQKDRNEDDSYPLLVPI